MPNTLLFSQHEPRRTEPAAEPIPRRRGARSMREATRCTSPPASLERATCARWTSPPAPSGCAPTTTPGTPPARPRRASRAPAAGGWRSLPRWSQRVCRGLGAGPRPASPAHLAGAPGRGAPASRRRAAACPLLGAPLSPLGLAERSQASPSSGVVTAGFTYNASSLSRVGAFRTPLKDGWGLAALGSGVVASDGSSRLSFLDPSTWALQRSVEANLPSLPTLLAAPARRWRCVCAAAAGLEGRAGPAPSPPPAAPRCQVTDEGRPVANLNELEVVEGEASAPAPPPPGDGRRFLAPPRRRRRLHGRTGRRTDWAPAVRRCGPTCG